MRSFGVAWLVPALLALSTASACSAARVVGPPPDHERRWLAFECTSDYGYPVSDAIIAGAGGIGGLISAASTGARGSSGWATATVAVGAAVWGLAWGASAYSGARKVARCRDAKVKLAVRRPESMVPLPEPLDSRLGGGPGERCGGFVRCWPRLECVQGRCIPAAARGARASVPATASPATAPTAASCDDVVQEVCTCTGPPAPLVARFCFEAERSRSAHGPGPECTMIARSLRRSLPCAAQGGP